MEQQYDVIIAGSGVAGMTAALHLNPQYSVLLLSKKETMLCNTALAQGGVAAVTDRQHDCVESHIHDTFVAGGFRNDPESTRILAEEGPDDVLELLQYGVDFDKAPDGSFDLTLEGGHTHRRILHHRDCTGREIAEKLAAAVKARPNITVLEEAPVCAVQKVSGGFWLQVWQEGEARPVSARRLILATGGIGQVYQYTTNPEIATGDGIAFAHQLGARIKNLHLVQFHPTAFHGENSRECFLISESVRGEGAVLLNGKKKRFMHRYDSRLELAPRDVVSRSILKEQARTGSDKFYLDISGEEPEFVRNRFPMIYEHVLAAGYDMTKEPIPVYPCQHYLMGGIDVDTEGRTTVDRLYACGECAHTGVHGNNRLASNSLLEALVFGRRIAEEINAKAPEARPIEPYVFPDGTNSVPVPEELRAEVRQIMQRACFVTPDPAEAEQGLARVTALKQELENGCCRRNPDDVQTLSIVTVAAIILKEITEKGTEIK